MMPKGIPRASEASAPTSWPILVILNAVLFIISATAVRSSVSSICERAALTTPGPETPTLSTQSGSPAPWKAPAMKGLSSGALQNTTSFAAPMHCLSRVFSAACLMIPPIIETASMFIPDFVLPTFTDEHTYSVSARASGMERMRSLSPGENPLWTRAE